MWNHRKHLWLKQSAKHLIFFNNNKIITISYKCNLYVVCASKSRLISNCAWRLNWEWEQIGKQTILCLPGRWHIYFDFRSQFIKFSAKFYEIRKTWLPAGNYYLRKFGTENEYIVVCPETGFLQLNSSRKDQFRVEYDNRIKIQNTWEMCDHLKMVRDFFLIILVSTLKFRKSYGWTTKLKKVAELNFI